jgi:hypothetical protein
LPYFTALLCGSVGTGEIRRAVGLITGWHARGIEDSRQHFDLAWRSFIAQKRFWAD